jgi:Ras-related protein Rab-7A
LKQGSPDQPDQFPFIVLANKSDRQAEREVEESAVQAFLSAHPNIKHFITSAKMKEGVSNAFREIALASVANRIDEM